MMLTGSAPIEKQVLDFCKIAFSVPLVEGYGLSESTAHCTSAYVYPNETGTIGGLSPLVKVKLRDLPEFNYRITDHPPRGELMIYGPSVMQGYFKDPEKTAEALENGWLKTGDVAQINPNGSLKIIDRAKNIFKLSQGEYIAPEKLENIFLRSNLISQMWITGNSTKNHIVAFVYPDPEVVGAEYNDDDVIERILAEIKRLASEFKLNSLELPKQFKLLKEPFTIENGFLTNTMKFKRHFAKE